MNKNIISDHSSYWSDINAKQNNRISSPEAKDTYKQAPASRCYSPGFPDQALQTLWKARMQVCQRPWTWPQVLPVRQPARQHAANGLCSSEIPGAGRRVCREFSPDKTAFGRNQLDQPGTSSPPRTAIGILHGTFRSRHDDMLCRHWQDRHPCCQYARSNSASRIRRIFFKGGPGR